MAARASESVSSAPGLRLAVATYVAILAIKLAAYLASGILVILAEALHSLSDVIVAAFLLAAERWSRRESDAVHMFGYGRAQNVAALVAATLFISFTSYKLFEEALPRLFYPAVFEPRYMEWALAAIGVSMVVSAAPLWSLLTQRQRGPLAQAMLMELLNDQVGLMAALAGIVGLWWGWTWIDPVATLAVASLIAVNALGLFRENASFLIGRSPGAAVLGALRSAALSVDGVLEVKDIRAEFVGPAIVHAGLHVLVRPGTPVEEADRIADLVRDRVHEQVLGQYCLVRVGALSPQSEPLGQRQAAVQ
jgi:cation diffusion facilitator family transporter